ncbi:MAG: hypothetical protein QOK48_3622, partial [Blastocatellia bacterium]|nr:hypothetical protein [Blastocatellia bacterium]
MKTGKLSHKIGALIFALTFVVGAGLGSAAGQGRRNRNWDGYPNWGGSYDLRQTALNAGYNEGSKEGRNDRNRNRHSDYSSFSAFQKATQDYSSRLGDRELYRRYYQLAFSRGYETENPGQIINDRNDRNNDRDRNSSGRRGRNWDRYGTYGGSYQLRQTALNAGYNEGIKQGLNDRKRNRHRNY